MTTVVLVQQGGTGANSASAARAALGAYSNSGGTISGQVAITGSGLALNVANNVFFGSNVAIGAQVENFPLYVERNSLGVTSVFLSEDGVLNPRVVIYGNNQGSVIQHTYSANASNLLFTIGGSLGDGVEAMRITENRNIGLGETNPTAKLHVNGSAIFSQDVSITGNLFLQGNTTYINVATLNVSDPLIFLGANNTLTDSVDIGFVGAKNTSGTFSHTGFARDATDGKYKLFDGLPDSDHVGNVINFANTYLATLVANVEANTLSVVNGVTGNVNFDSGTLFVDSINNRVGIGTTDPTANLHVTGTIKDTPIVSVTSSGTYADNAAGRVIFANTTSAITITAAAAATAGFSYTVIRGNTGNVTIANSGVTRLNSASITTMNVNQYGAVTVVYTATNQIIVFGDFVA